MQIQETSEIKNITADLLKKMDAYWRAANYLSVGQILADKSHKYPCAGT